MITNRAAVPEIVPVPLAAAASDANEWGLLFVEDPSRAAPAARILWTPCLDSSVIEVAASTVQANGCDEFDLARMPMAPTIVVSAEGRQHVSLTDGFRRIRIDVTSGSVLDGPVRLHYQLAGIEGVEPKLLTIQRLIALIRLGRFAKGLEKPEPRAARWMTMLRVHDALSEGASQREIASVLFGERRVQAEWRQDSDSLRLRIQRLIRSGEGLVRGGYKGLLSGGGGRVNICQSARRQS